MVGLGYCCVDFSTPAKNPVLLDQNSLYIRTILAGGNKCVADGSDDTSESAPDFFPYLVEICRGI